MVDVDVGSGGGGPRASGGAVMLALRAGRRAARAVGCRKAVTLYSAKLRGAEDFGHLLADNFRLAPTAAAEFIVENLEPQDRLSLLQALTRAEGPLASSLDDKYVADLLRSADRQADGALEQCALLARCCSLAGHANAFQPLLCVASECTMPIISHGLVL